MRLPAALLLVPFLVEDPAPPPKPESPPAGPVTPRAADRHPEASPAAKVIAAVAAAAAEDAALPAEKRAAPGALADLLVRRAAAAAGGDARAFLVGLGFALDPGGTLARHPFAAADLQEAETAEQARARLAALGKPALRGRKDLLLHFTVSAALRAVAGEAHAEAAGVAKELADSRGGTGFSFADLLADLAGIRFAGWLLEKDSAARLKRVAEGFRGDDFLPDPSREPEGLQEGEFARRYGSVDDERFLAKRKALADAVGALAVYRPPAK